MEECIDFIDKHIYNLQECKHNKGVSWNHQILLAQLFNLYGFWFRSHQNLHRGEINFSYYILLLYAQAKLVS